MLESEEKDSELLKHLGSIIKEGKHFTIYNGKTTEFLCLKVHIKEANKRLKEPYGKKDLRILLKNVKRFLREIAKRSKDRTKCTDLIEIIAIVPTATKITRFENYFNFSY